MAIDKFIFMGYDKNYGEDIGTAELTDFNIFTDEEYQQALEMLEYSAYFKKGEDILVSEYPQIVMNIDVDMINLTYEFHFYGVVEADGIEKKMKKLKVNWEVVQQKGGYRYIKIPLMDSFGTSNQAKVSSLWKKGMKLYEKRRGFRADDDPKPTRGFSCAMRNTELFHVLDDDEIDDVILLELQLSTAILIQFDLMRQRYERKSC